ncbi:PITH domain-containing protein 1 [Lamellibrachia satsuma]|nr:PITH domain-containing protein 1 [Lamellibrachia satsuma]
MQQCSVQRATFTRDGAKIKSVICASTFVPCIGIDPNMTFDGAVPRTGVDLPAEHSRKLEYATKIARFSQTGHLSIHFPRNFGADTTKVYYIGLKGDFMEAPHHQITITNYEARANPADHKTKNMNSVGHQIF